MTKTQRVRSARLSGKAGEVPKPQRVRDPLHDLIEFSDDEFEQIIWRVIQTQPFQRLRRIKQLGFSELVFPGATHTRFAHSLGVFHTARRLMGIVDQHLGQSARLTRQHTALAAALVHDVGHGPFSHAFEEVGDKLGLDLADHEKVSDYLIRDSEIAEELSEYMRGFPEEVADVVKREGPHDIYDAVVSSQFDADRLDYMRRDRLMTGAKSGSIDFEWLMANLEVGSVPYNVDEEIVGHVETFVLGPKAGFAAEAYVLGLFQLYPTVYFHKTTRGAEKIFSALLERVVFLSLDGSVDQTGLPVNHPLVKFARQPDSLDNLLELDDTAVWGALCMLVEAPDAEISALAKRLKNRDLLKCVDIRQRIVHTLFPMVGARQLSQPEYEKRIEKAVLDVEQKVYEWRKADESRETRILIDRQERDPYKRFQESKGPLNQIRIRLTGGEVADMAEHSAVVSALAPFRLFRAYVDPNDDEARTFLESAIKAACAEGSAQDASGEASKGS